MNDVPEMVERVARAMSDELCSQSLTSMQYDSLSSVTRDRFHRAASAALRAMRIPTEAMRYAVWYDQYITCGGTPKLADFCAREKLNDEKQRQQDISSFSACIDAALASPPKE